MEPPEGAARMIYARELTPVNVESTLNMNCTGANVEVPAWADTSTFSRIDDKPCLDYFQVARVA